MLDSLTILALAIPLLVVPTSLWAATWYARSVRSFFAIFLLPAIALSFIPLGLIYAYSPDTFYTTFWYWLITYAGMVSLSIYAWEKPEVY